MTKGFKRLAAQHPIADIKKALALMRYRTVAPNDKSLAYTSLKVCAQILKISYTKAHQLA